MRLYSWKTLAFGLTALGLSQTAQAATITYNSVLPSIGYAQWDGQSVFTQFDPSLGTLEGVTYEVAGAITFSVSQSAAFTIIPTDLFSKALTLDGAGLTPKDPGEDSGADVFLNGGMSGQSLQPGVTLSQTIAVDFFRTPDLGLSPFVGNGTIMTDLLVGEDSDECYSDDLNGAANHMSCTQSGGLTVSVTYDYAPAGDTSVPEPRSFALLGFGVLALGQFRRRVRRP